MKGNQLARILRFAQQTHDKVIVTDSEGKEPVVVMPFDMYEHLISVSQLATTSRVGAKEEEFGGFEQAPDVLFAPQPREQDDLAIQPTMVKVEGSEEKKPQGFEGEEEQFYLEPVE